MHDTRHIPIEITVSETALKDLVVGHYAIRPVAIAPLGGYSNLNYRITDPAGQAYVLRVSRVNRTADSAHAEWHVLRSLERAGYALTPHLIRPLAEKSRPEGLTAKTSGEPSAGLEAGNLVQELSGYVQTGNRADGPLQVEFQGANHFVQLSHLIPGSIDCFWWQQCSIDKIEQIFRGLASLHRTMAAIPPLQELPAPAFQYTLPEQVPELLSATPTGQYVLDHWQAFRQSAIRLQMDMADRYPWQDARYQWIHGDVQLENLLFEGGYLTGFLDFERVSWDACEKDVIFSAFRVCKEGNTDAPFQYDRARLARAIEAYQEGEEVRREQSDPELTLNEKAAGLCPFFFSGYEEWWKPFFCLDQAMVYLENAFDGTWQLADGIGFLPCFEEVLHYRGPQKDGGDARYKR